MILRSCQKFSGWGCYTWGQFWPLMDCGDQQSDDNCAQRASGSVFMTQEEAEKACCACNSCHRCPLNNQRLDKGASSTAFYTIAPSESPNSFNCDHEPKISVYSGLDDECLSPASPGSAMNVIGPLPIGYQGPQGATRCFNSAAIGDKYGLTYYLLGILSFLSLCGSVAMGGENLQMIIKEWASQLLFGVSAVAFAPVGYSLIKDTIHGFNIKISTCIPASCGGIKTSSSLKSTKTLLGDLIGRKGQTHPMFSQNDSPIATGLNYNSVPNQSFSTTLLGQNVNAGETSVFGPSSTPSQYQEDLQPSSSPNNTGAREESGSGSLIAVAVFMLVLGTGVAGGLYWKWREQETKPFYKRPSAILGTLLLLSVTGYSLMKNQDVKTNKRAKKVSKQKS